MNPILQAMASGYGINKILKYISQSNPQLASKISSAVSYGYTANEILKYVMQGGSSASSSLPKASKMDMNLYDKMQYSLPEDIENVAQIGLGLGAAGLGYFASQMGNQSGNTPQNTPVNPTNPPVPGAPVNPPPNAPQTPGQMATPQTPMPGANIGQQIQQGAQAPINAAMQSTSPQQVGQAAQAIPQQQQNIPIFEQLLGGVDVNSLDPSQQNQLKFLSMISDQLESQGKDLSHPEFKKLAEKVKKTLEGKAGVVMEEVTRGLSQESPKIEKKSVVETPNGVGEVKAVSNGKALVEISGKTHKIDEAQLIQSPLPEKDLADLYDDLISGIEKETEEDVSRMVDWAGYDPKTNTLAFLPHTGALYTYRNISPEQAKQLTDILSVRKTSGENFIGAWKEGSKSPIGAAMSSLIRELQKERGGKGSEYEEKFETLYKALEPAITALKNKKRKKKK